MATLGVILRPSVHNLLRHTQRRHLLLPPAPVEVVHVPQVTADGLDTVAHRAPVTQPTLPVIGQQEPIGRIEVTAVSRGRDWWEREIDTAVMEAVPVAPVAEQRHPATRAEMPCARLF